MSADAEKPSTDQDAGSTKATKRARPGRPSDRAAIRRASQDAFNRATPVEPYATTQSAPELPGQTAIPTEEAPAKTSKNAQPIRSMTVRLYDKRDSEALDRWMSQARGKVDGRPSFDRLAREVIRVLAADKVISEIVLKRMAEKTEQPAGSRRRSS